MAKSNYNEGISGAGCFGYGCAAVLIFLGLALLMLGGIGVYPLMGGIFGLIVTALLQSVSRKPQNFDSKPYYPNDTLPELRNEATPETSTDKPASPKKSKKQDSNE